MTLKPGKSPRSDVFSRWWSDDVRSTIDHKEVMERVRADAGWSAHFIVMTLLSAGIAILGLLLSSPAVVIGAMLISPLMGPIIGAGFALATLDWTEIRRALLALILGSLLAVGFCALIALVSPIQTVTAEIAGRTRPNLFDLMVALLSGLAGTYAVIRGRHGAIVGVAIATALMPPLAVMGFGIATTNWPVFSGSSLLFFTNLMTIAAAAAALARMYGFATDLSPHHTRLQLLVLVGSLLMLAIPLGLSLKRIAWETVTQREAQFAIAQAFGEDSHVSDLQVHFHSRPLEIEATVLTPKYRPKLAQTLSDRLERTIGQRVSLTIDQVRISGGDAAALDLGTSAPSALAANRAGSRVSQEVAMIAGVSPEEVLVDGLHKRARARAAALPGATLATYREMERRLAQANAGWTIELAPPLMPLPDELDDEAHSTAIWAATRLGLPLRVDGSRANADQAADAIEKAGVTVERGRSVGPLKLEWAVAAPEQAPD